MADPYVMQEPRPRRYPQTVPLRGSVGGRPGTTGSDAVRACAYFGDFRGGRCLRRRRVKPLSGPPVPSRDAHLPPERQLSSLSSNIAAPSLNRDRLLPTGRAGAHVSEGCRKWHLRSFHSCRGDLGKSLREIGQPGQVLNRPDNGDRPTHDQALWNRALGPTRVLVVGAGVG